MNAQPLIIFGGSFDPFHLGHLKLCEQLLKLEAEVWVLPAAHNPLKDEASCEAKHRLAMVQEALADQPLRVHGGQITGQAPPLMMDFIDEEVSIDRELSLLIGSDLLPGLKQWARSEALQKRVKLLVVPRPHYPTNIPNAWQGELLDWQAPEISSSAIKKTLSQGEISQDLPGPVQAYIASQGLYGSKKA